MLSPSRSHEFGEYLRVTSAALAERDGIPLEDAREYMLDTYRIDMAPAILADLLKQPTVTGAMPLVVALVRRLLALAPDSPLRRLARMVYRRAGWISVDAVHGTELRARPVPGARAEFDMVRRFLARGAADGIQG